MMHRTLLGSVYARWGLVETGYIRQEALASRSANSLVVDDMMVIHLATMR